MRGFHFGQIKPHSSGEGDCGSFVLHLQCSWRLESPQEIITGHRDLWEPETEEGWNEDWDYEDGNLQDRKLTELLGSYDFNTRSCVNSTEKLIVESVEIINFGDLIIKLSGGYQIVTFINHTIGESWRFFSPGTKEKHICMIMEADKIKTKGLS